MYQTIPTLLTLVLLLPLLVTSTSHSTTISTSSATSPTCPVAKNLTLPISPPSPDISDMGLQTHPSLIHCCLQQPVKPSAHGLWSALFSSPATTPHSEKGEHVDQDCIRAYFSHGSRSQETSTRRPKATSTGPLRVMWTRRLRARDSSGDDKETEIKDVWEQRSIVDPDGEIREWVLIDHTEHLIEEPKSMILGREVVSWWGPLMMSVLSFVILGRKVMFWVPLDIWSCMAEG